MQIRNCRTDSARSATIPKHLSHFVALDADDMATTVAIGQTQNVEPSGNKTRNSAILPPDRKTRSFRITIESTTTQVR